MSTISSVASLSMMRSKTRPGDQDKPTRRLGERGHDRRKAKLLERRDLAANAPDGETDDAPLPEHVHAEPAHAGQGVPEVGLARVLELASLVIGHQGLREDLGGGRRQVLEPCWLQGTVHADVRRVAHLQVKVARSTLDRVPKQFVDIHARPRPSSEPALDQACRPAPRVQGSSKHRPVSGCT